jgi:hypothetical protein
MFRKNEISDKEVLAAGVASMLITEADGVSLICKHRFGVR